MSSITQHPDGSATIRCNGYYIEVKEDGLYIVPDESHPQEKVEETED